MALRDYVTGPVQRGLVSQAMQGISLGHQKNVDRAKNQIELQRIGLQLRQLQLNQRDMEVDNARQQLVVEAGIAQEKNRLNFQKQKLVADTNLRLYQMKQENNKYQEGLKFKEAQLAYNIQEDVRSEQREKEEFSARQSVAERNLAETNKSNAIDEQLERDKFNQRKEEFAAQQALRERNIGKLPPKPGSAREHISSHERMAGRFADSEKWVDAWSTKPLPNDASKKDKSRRARMSALGRRIAQEVQEGFNMYSSDLEVQESYRARFGGPWNEGRYSETLENVVVQELIDAGAISIEDGDILDEEKFDEIVMSFGRR